MNENVVSMLDVVMNGARTIASYRNLPCPLRPVHTSLYVGFLTLGCSSGLINPTLVDLMLPGKRSWKSEAETTRENDCKCAATMASWLLAFTYFLEHTFLFPSSTQHPMLLCLILLLKPRGQVMPRERWRELRRHHLISNSAVPFSSGVFFLMCMRLTRRMFYCAANSMSREKVP